MKYLLPLIILTLFSFAKADVKNMDKLQKQAQVLYSQGDFKDAFKLYQELLTSGVKQISPTALDNAVNCLWNINEAHEFDAFIESVIAANQENPTLLIQAAYHYRSAQKHGYIVAGEFNRGYYRGQGGRYALSSDRDRVRSAQLLLQAWPLVTDDTAILKAMAETLLMDRNHDRSWKLQNLTDLTALPDYDENYYYSSGAVGAPVDSQGKPIFYEVPKSFESARNDGERWRFLLARLADKSESEKHNSQWQWADFLWSQFGVQTLADYRIPDSSSDDSAEKPIFSLETLGDTETIARLGGGIQRFTLPEEYNYISIFKQLAKTNISALDRLAQIYENRRQLTTAADYWQQALAKGDTQWRRNNLQQIIGAWGQFEPLSGVNNEQVTLRFRNATSVSFDAIELKTEQFLNDVKSHLRVNSKNLQWNKLYVERIGYQILQNNQKHYLGNNIKSWVTPLTPSKGHHDRYTTIDLPKNIQGAYLLKATVAGGNTSYIVVWNHSAIIVKKPLDEKTLYYVADSMTGKPLVNAELTFFGYQVRNNDIDTKSITLKTDERGQIVVDNNTVSQNYQWLVHTRAVDNHFAFLGFSYIWYGQHHWREHYETKAYAISSQPVYRPGQSVKFNAWLRQAKYDLDYSTFANQSVNVEIYNPKQEKIYSKAMTTNEFGAVTDQLELAAKADLGVYRITIESYHAGQFRVEEYKKPEFSVSIDAPTDPIALGDKIKATIKAQYYFGAPVTHAKVKYKIMRYDHNARWYPQTSWDWFYGPGYWWFAYNTPWLKGWHHWGYESPIRHWWPMSHNPPELIQESEASISEDGTVEVMIDTSIAKLLRNDTDHRYEITAEVVDQSRRTIVGSGDVLVARQPFKVYAWVNRGYYQQGDTIDASFAAKTIAQKAISGKGEVILYHISYDDHGNPSEKPVQKWPLDPDSNGEAKLQLVAGNGGQYRLAYTVVDKDNHQIEGAYIFNVVGTGKDTANYRFNALELIADKAHYEPGESVKLMLNSAHKNANVLLFIRPIDGVYEDNKTVVLAGNTTIEAIEVHQGDMPNFYVEALTVFNGEVHTEVKEIFVPPVKKALNVSIVPSKKVYKPGEEASITFLLTDANGKPFSGSTVIAVYDKALEYIAGDMVPNISDYFWKWRRYHNPNTEHSASFLFYNMSEEGDQVLQIIGALGHQVEQDEFKLERRESEGASLASAELLEVKDNMAPAPAAAQKSKNSMERTRGQQSNTEVAVRKNFADAAFWQANITTDENGKATVKFTLPENLTSWKTTVWAMGHGTEVGQASADIITTKPLLIRMQAPRFFVEKDEVVLSANIHNYLKQSETVEVVLELDGEHLQRLDSADQRITIAANGEARVDWRVKANAEGLATIRMIAKGDTESDAMEMKFPVKVHGMLKTESFSGSLNNEQTNGVINFVIPDKRRAEQTRLELRYSPSIAASLVDALPYLVSYPYGCTEQTLSRFLPTVMVQNSLKLTGVDLNHIKDKRTNLNAQEIGDDQQRAAKWQRYDHNPVFDQVLVDDMTQEGLNRLYSMQLSDGGWGWFSGWGERSSPHTTAYVVHGLQVALQSGISVDQQVLERGIAWLEHYQATQLQHLNNAKNKVDPYKVSADNMDAFIAMVLSDAKKANKQMMNYLYRDRNHLSVYGKSLLALALHNTGQLKERDQVRSNIEQLLIMDDENQTAYLNLGNSSYWWYWYGNEFEAQAYYLKLLAKVEPKGDIAPRLVKYLMNNRRQAGYWTSTRDTAMVIEAVTEYLVASGENEPDLSLDILLDGKKVKTVSINKDNLFEYDNRLIIEGLDLSSGEHNIEIVKRGTGPLYYNAYVTNFTLEDFIEKAGLEVKVERRYYKLEPMDKEVLARGASGQALSQKAEKYQRIPVDADYELKSGDLVEVELVIESKNDYEYLLIEDMKAAGFEPIDVRSGYNGNELRAYVEYRDDRVSFFVTSLARGKHSVSYRLKAEIPGKFSALPTRIEAMYAPEIKANSDENKLIVEE